MKKERKTKSDKVYLKKGYYALNDIYYDIFRSNNGKHYFSFINNNGRTVLLNGDINGFETLVAAEKAIEEVLKNARDKNRFEIKTAKDGKFFFNLYNDKGDKIAKSFFFRKKEDIEKSLNEFVIGTPSQKVGTTATRSAFDSNKKTEANIIPISQNLKEDEIKSIAERKEKVEKEEALLRAKKRQEERALADKKWQEEKRLRQLEREQKEKERKILLAAKKEKREKERKIKEQERAELAKVNATKTPKKDDDLFDGCFRWLWILCAFVALALLLSYFKGCFGNMDSFKSETNNTTLVDSLNSDNKTEIKDLSSEENYETNNSSLQDGDDGTNDTIENSNAVGSNGYQQGDQEVAGCDCGSKAIVFDLPATEAKIINKLGTNPQFGNTHGLTPADFMEELKYRYQSNSWDRKYLNYLYKAMGYNGFQDAQATQFSSELLNKGAKGILGFGSYSGYAHSELNLNGKDLEVFRIEAANGCHINFMKTCGNLFFMCK